MAPDANEHPAPSLFISYASEDREVARRLRDTISALGINVWYDEDELIGGDAWDKKIRDRIRACDYFMPLISKATEARREGYFRREWRQAAERTLDMSDDVMFLLPVNIDDISAYRARVPERFNQVQWTLCPTGESNPELESLCGRMLRREDAAPVVSTPPPPPNAKPSKAKSDKSLPPYPPQPKRTADEAAWLHAFNLVVWIVRCAYRAYLGFPRVLRWIVIIWFVSMLISRCNSDRGTDYTPSNSSPQDPSTESAPASGFSPEIREAVNKEFGGLEGLGGFGRIIGAVADAAQTGRTLALVPFTTTAADEADSERAKTVFNQLMSSLRAFREDEIALSPLSLGTDPSAAELGSRIARIESRFLLTGWTEQSETDASAHLQIVLHLAGDPVAVWTGRYSLTDSDPTAIADEVRSIILQKVFLLPETEAASAEAAPIP